MGLSQGASQKTLRFTTPILGGPRVLSPALCESWGSEYGQRRGTELLAFRLRFAHTSESFCIPLHMSALSVTREVRRRERRRSRSYERELEAMGVVRVRHPSALTPSMTP